MQKYKRGDIWFCKKVGTFSKGILSGSRPVLIISNDKWNADSLIVNVVLISSNVDKCSPVHVEIDLDMKSAINVEQIHTIPKSDLDRYMKTLSNEEMGTVNNALKFQLDLFEML